MRRRARRWLPKLAAILALGALTGCDPCSGVVGCAGDDRFSVHGRIVDVTNGRPVPGTTISFVRTGGIVTALDTASTITDDDGLFGIAFDAQGKGSSTFDVVVSPANKPSYRVSGVDLATTAVRGDAHVLGLWVSEPYFALGIELFYRGNPTKLITDVNAVFRRTGGAQLTGPGWVNDEYRAGVDSFGRLSLFNNTVFSAGGEETIGDVYLELPAPMGTSVVRGIRLTREHVYSAPVPLVRRGGGPSLGYFGRFVNRATSAPMSGVGVSFAKTGGIPVAKPDFSGVTNAGGEFTFQLDPLGAGTLVGDLTVRPAAPDTAFVIRGLRIDTFDDDGAKFYAQWGIGLHLPWVGVVRAQGRGLAGVEVEARRASGINATPSVLTVRSDANGVFPLNGFVPASAGNLVVDLTFRPPAPYATFVVRGVVLATFNVDSDARVAGVWNADQPPALR